MDLHITELYKYVTYVFRDSDLHYMPDVEREEQETDRMNNVMQASHLTRINEGKSENSFINHPSDMPRAQNAAAILFKSADCRLK